MSVTSDIQVNALCGISAALKSTIVDRHHILRPTEWQELSK